MCVSQYTYIYIYICICMCRRVFVCVCTSVAIWRISHQSGNAHGTPGISQSCRWMDPWKCWQLAKNMATDYALKMFHGFLFGHSNSSGVVEVGQLRSVGANLFSDSRYEFKCKTPVSLDWKRLEFEGGDFQGVSLAIWPSGCKRIALREGPSQVEIFGRQPLQVWLLKPIISSKIRLCDWISSFLHWLFF